MSSTWEHGFLCSRSSQVKTVKTTPLIFHIVAYFSLSYQIYLNIRYNSFKKDFDARKKTASAIEAVFLS